MVSWYFHRRTLVEVLCRSYNVIELLYTKGYGESVSCDQNVRYTNWQWPLPGKHGFMCSTSGSVGPNLVHCSTLKPRQNGRLFADDTFKRIFLNEDIRISTKISLKFVPKGLINNIPALVLIMAWRRPGDKPLSDPMLVRSLTHICVTRPQWVKGYSHICNIYTFQRYPNLIMSCYILLNLLNRFHLTLWGPLY